MSPRRVLVEFKSNNWTLGQSNSKTLEDMIEDRLTDGYFYFDTDGDYRSDLEVDFEEGQVVFIRKSYIINESEHSEQIEQARKHLSELGRVSEKTTAKDSSLRLEYRPHKYSFVGYDFYKLVENQRSYNVWYYVGNFKHYTPE